MLKILRVCLWRHPAAFQVQAYNLPVVAVEKSQQVLRQISLVLLGKRAHDGAVKTNVGWVFRVCDVNKHIARVHVGMKKVLPEHLGEEDFHAEKAELCKVHPGGLHDLHLVGGCAVYALHDHYFAPGEIPVHERNIEFARAQPVAAELRGIAGLQGEVQLAADGVAVVRNQVQGPQPPAFCKKPGDKAGKGAHQPEVLLDDLLYTRPYDLDHHLLTGFQPGCMHLGN